LDAFLKAVAVDRAVVLTQVGEGHVCAHALMLVGLFMPTAIPLYVS
jgi:hypothetical protein